MHVNPASCLPYIRIRLTYTCWFSFDIYETKDVMYI